MNRTRILIWKCDYSTDEFFEFNNYDGPSLYKLFDENNTIYDRLPAKW